jgi:hypothetical protein
VATRQNGRRWQRLFLGYEKEGAGNPTKVLLETIDTKSPYGEKKGSRL